MISDQQAYGIACDLVASAPAPGAFRVAQTPTLMKWIGDLAAITEAKGTNSQKTEYLAANELMSSILPQMRNDAARRYLQLAYGMKSALELLMPASARASFIPTGSSFDGLTAVGKILGEAAGQIILVDPYMDHIALEKFASFASVNVVVKLLTDAASVKPTLIPACQSWRQQHGGDRPVELRAAPARALHDRVIIIDSARAWSVSQSLKDLAERSPALIQEVAQDVRLEKIEAYNAIWDGAQVLI